MGRRMQCMACLSTAALMLTLSLVAFFLITDKQSIICSENKASFSKQKTWRSIPRVNSSISNGKNRPASSSSSSSSTPRPTSSSKSCSKHAILCHRPLKEHADSSMTKLLSSFNHESLKFLFHGMLSSLEYTCPSKRSFGKAGLGVYEICMVSNIQPRPGDCLVYSFGISNDWSFDEEMAKFGCEVHSFDPSIGKEDHVHAPNVTFHNVGLWGSDIVNSNGWKLERFSTIRKRLGHEQRVIDILKVDVEGGEWPFLRDVLYRDPSQLTTVRQLLMELHSPRFKHETVTKRDYVEMINYFRDLRQMDFEVFKNFHDGNCCEVFASFMPPEIPERCCEEIAMVNKQFL